MDQEDVFISKSTKRNKTKENRCCYFCKQIQIDIGIQMRKEEENFEKSIRMNNDLTEKQKINMKEINELKVSLKIKNECMKAKQCRFCNQKNERKSMEIWENLCI